MRKLKLSHCPDTKNKAMGNFHILGNKQYLITVSEAQTKPVIEYVHTVVHELLHFVFTLVRIKYKTQLTERKEHKVIEKMEAAITDIFVEEVLRPREK